VCLGGKLSLLLFQLLDQLAVAAAHLVWDASHVDRGKQTEDTKVNDWSVGVGKVASPLAAATEYGDSGNVDIDTFGHVNVDVAEEGYHGHSRFRVLDFDVAKIQIEIRDDGDCERATT
jgi:hypothetical protein